MFGLSLQDVHAWTDSTIVLNWLVSSSRQFKTYVGNRVSHIVDLVGPDHWHHVSGTDNPAYCTSWGLYPSDLLNHQGPEWLLLGTSEWPQQSMSCLMSLTKSSPHYCRSNGGYYTEDRYSSFTCLKRVTTWVIRFFHNYCARLIG